MRLHSGVGCVKEYHLLVNRVAHCIELVPTNRNNIVAAGVHVCASCARSSVSCMYMGRVCARGGVGCASA